MKVTVSCLNGKSMNYIELNDYHRNKIASIIGNNVVNLDWENPELMSILLGGLNISRYHYANKESIRNEENDLQKELNQYDSFNSDKELFFAKIQDLVNSIREKEENWRGISLFDLNNNLKMHRFCLIHGEGGIGKSYFLKCFEEKLTENGIPHLCIYGKFEKDISRIDKNGILNKSNNGFVFIIDAINEMSKNGQIELLNLVSELKQCSKIRIVLSYRDNSLMPEILSQFEKVAEISHRFTGVSFEHALKQMVRKGIPDVYKYEDILFSNNALMLNMLCKILESGKIGKNGRKGITSVTFLLENYIEKSVNRIKDGDSNYYGRNAWEDTKKIAGWMHQNHTDEIGETVIDSLVNEKNEFIDALTIIGIVGKRQTKTDTYYYFTNESLSDFLIVRSLFQKISKKSTEEIAKLIKEHFEENYRLKEPLIIALFDSLSPEYERIKTIIKLSGLDDYFDYETLLKIHFEKSDIDTFTKAFEATKSNELLRVIGGYTDKPYNCSNYLFDYYTKGEFDLRELSDDLTGDFKVERIKNRLRNLLYFVALSKVKEINAESYYFALLCSASPNEEVRVLATKLLYDIVSSDKIYIAKSIKHYNDVNDCYIKDAIIHTLSKTAKGNSIVITFFKGLIHSKEMISSKNISRISRYLNDEHGYILWDRENLYTREKDTTISDYLDKLLWNVEMSHKGFLPFKYTGKNGTVLYESFIETAKEKVIRVNNWFKENYKCVKYGKCSGWMAFESIVEDEIRTIAEIREIDKNSFFCCFERIIKTIFQMYMIVSKDYDSLWGRENIDSIVLKCTDIAASYFYGSLMCNYFTSEFATYNSNRNCIGYSVYDPLDYGDDYNIASPIPIFNDLVESMDNEILNKISCPEKKSRLWKNDRELSRNNIISIINPFEFNGQEWCLLCGEISLKEVKDHKIVWEDFYSIRCCTNAGERLEDKEEKRKLTIELLDYAESIEDYQRCIHNSWLCKKIKRIYLPSEYFDDASLVFPPSEIIRELHLHYNRSDSCWYDDKGTLVAVCNNNNHSYFEDPIVGTVFIRNDYLDLFKEKKTLKYFAFGDRFYNERTERDDNSFHYEIADNMITKEFHNKSAVIEKSNNSKCLNCSHPQVLKKMKEIENLPFPDVVIKL